ncbi:MAG: hypothetical protein J0L82_17250 [Deltaproteobacteria bacterium]|nr:hypothetical protein [Deltaproteobacteria bacterium]
MNTSRLKLLGFFGAIILLSPTLSYSAQTNSTCDPSRIRIEQATSLEQKSACVAIRQLEDFFLKMAAPVTLDVTLKFENEVFLPLASTGGEKTRVYGYFDSDKFEVVQSHFRSAYQVGRRSPWSLKWSDALAHSFLLHELSHLAVMKYLKSIGRSERQVAPEWHEAIAYTIQFLLMDSRLRNQIFEKNQQTVADHIKEPARLASSNYREDPAFAMRC